MVMLWTTFATPLQVLRVKMFSTPFSTSAPRFEANDAKATYWPVAQGIEEEVAQEVLMLGFSLGPFAALVPSEVEIS